ncbi:polysaccharide biosynthesis C-terminal domain-containing protein [Limosilactobacillus vaginalis]|uniref:Polysaccharide biosynthesis C-terminal domain-containing protein n=1 Tax=Limosilactobacillus vaginalis TaxID=1633 RepID=A0AAW5WUP0_9LACO|nr:polysaccharide biosynthesis C-terminal domain-containing protein [Limosilactobacillus vaginalis]MCZ3668280.1 polysaccharide biosynthesis C-terminal domain-containing protein [Limosilactobacillus vaginalis]
MKVIKNYLYNAGYQILNMIIPLITVPYISRVLGAHDVGINEYTNSWVTFFFLMGQMGITLYGNREVAYHRDDLYKRSQTFWGVEALQLLTVSTAFILYLAAVFLFSTTFKEFFLLQAIWIIATGVDISWYFMGLEEFRITVVRNTLVKIASLILIFTVVKTSNDLGKYILILGASQLVGNLTLWPYLRGNIIWVSVKKWHPFKHFYPSLLLFIPTITTQVYLVLNRLMLGRMSTQADLGNFGQADKIVKFVLAVVTATGTVMLPHVANKFAKGDIKGVRNSLYSSFDFVSAISIPMMFGLMAIAKKFGPWFLGNGFVLSGSVMFIEAPIIVFIAWSNVTGTQYLMPINRVRDYTTSVTIGAVSNVVFNFLLIGKWGANGAALATVGSELLVTATQLVMIRKTISRRKIFKEQWKYIISGIAMFIIVNRICQSINMTISNLVLEIFVGVFIYIIGLILTKASIVQEGLKIIRKN